MRCLPGDDSRLPAIAQHQLDLVHRAAQFYVEHLEQRTFAVVICDDPVRAALLPSTPFVHVLPMGEYLSRFWPHLEQLNALFASLAASLAVAKAATSQQAGGAGLRVMTAPWTDCAGDERHAETQFRQHKSVAQLEAGVRSELYVSGPLSVSKHRPHTEAFVRAALDDKVWPRAREGAMC